MTRQTTSDDTPICLACGKPSLSWAEACSRECADIVAQMFAPPTQQRLHRSRKGDLEMDSRAPYGTEVYLVRCILSDGPGDWCHVASSHAAAEAYIRSHDTKGEYLSGHDWEVARVLVDNNAGTEFAPHQRYNAHGDPIITAPPPPPTLDPQNVPWDIYRLTCPPESRNPDAVDPRLMPR